MQTNTIPRYPGLVAPTAQASSRQADEHDCRSGIEGISEAVAVTSGTRRTASLSAGRAPQERAKYGTQGQSLTQPKLIEVKAVKQQAPRPSHHDRTIGAPGFNQDPDDRGKCVSQNAPVTTIER